MKKLKLRIIKFYFLILFIGIINLFPQTSYSELTKQDIQEIRIIIREELRPIEVRIESLDKRIDSLDKRIEDLRAIMLAGFAILFAGMFCMIGFVIWDRRTAIAPLSSKVKQIEGDITIESDKIKNLISVLKEIAVVDNKVKEALTKFGLL